MAKENQTKVIFLRDYSPRKKDEVVELDTALSNFYIQNGIAEVHTGESTNVEGSDCEDCKKASLNYQELEKANTALSEATEALNGKETELNTANEKIAELEGSLTTKSEELEKANTALSEATEALKKAQDELKKLKSKK